VSGVGLGKLVWVYQILVVIIEGEGAVLGVNLQRPIVTNGNFVASLCGSAYSDRAVVWRDEWVGPGIHVLDGSPRASRGRGCFWHGFWHFRHFCPILFNGEMTYRYSLGMG